MKPFLALRSYLPADHELKGKEIGSEPTPGEFLDTILDVVEACARVLTPYGSLVFEFGDTYSGSGGAGGDYNADGLRDGQPAFDGSQSGHRRAMRKGYGGAADRLDAQIPKKGSGWPLDKSLTLIPESFAWALAYGRNPWTGRETEPWRIRNFCPWVRPNPPVGSLGDKFRPGTSYLTVACKARDRWFDLDAVRTPGNAFHREGQHRGGVKAARTPDGGGYNHLPGSTEITNHPAGAPPLDWFNIPTQPYAGSHYACVDDQTEALTPSGWKCHDELEDGDTIAAYDKDRHVIVWQPANFHRYPFDGELVVIEKRETSQRLTPNHRVLIRSRKGFERVVRADELRPSHALPVAAPFDVPGEDIDPLGAALLGWYITEGSRYARQVCIYQSETANPKNCNRIRDLLDAVKATYVERRRVRPIGASLSPRESVEVTWTVSGRVASWLTHMAPDKQLDPALALGWSTEACEALLDAMIAGDGHTRPSGREVFVQKDRGTIDAVQALCCRLGFRSTISQRPDGVYSLTIGERSWLTLRGTNGASNPIPTEHYEGIVWCPSIESTFWLARRNGRPFITGNTWPEKLALPFIESMCPRQVCRVCGIPRRRLVTPTSYDTDRGETGRPLESLGAGHRSDRPSATPITRGWSECECPEFEARFNAGDSEYLGRTPKWRNGLVLDPFAGSGTTLQVATGCGRDAIGIDLDERNLELARARIGMFLVEEPERPVEDVVGL